MERRGRNLVLGGVVGVAALAAVAVMGTMWALADSGAFTDECRRVTYDDRTYYSVGTAVDRSDLVASDDPAGGEGPRSCDPGVAETLELRPANVRHIPGVDPAKAVVAVYDAQSGRDALYVADADYGRTGDVPDDVADALASSH